MLINSQCDFPGLEQASYPALHSYGWGHGAIAILNTFASNPHATANRIHRANTPLLFFHCTPHTIIFLSLIWISLEVETERTWNGSHISCRRPSFPRPLLSGSHENVGLKTLNHENVLKNTKNLFNNLWRMRLHTEQPPTRPCESSRTAQKSVKKKELPKQQDIEEKQAEQHPDGRL